LITLRRGLTGTVTVTAPAVPRLIEHRHDQWVDPREARTALAALAALAPLTLARLTAADLLDGIEPRKESPISAHLYAARCVLSRQRL